MDITTNCPHCQSAFTFDATMAGQQGTCPTCQAQITLKVPVRKPQPVPAPQSPARTSKTELAKLRDNTCYKSARGIINVTHAILTTLGVCTILLSFASGDGGTIAAGIGIGALTIVVAAVTKECGMVIFDIADTLIAARV